MKVDLCFLFSLCFHFCFAKGLAKCKFGGINHAPWLANIVNYLVTSQIPLHGGQQDKLKFLSIVKTFF
jgi:hypothetical protein